MEEIETKIAELQTDISDIETSIADTDTPEETRAELQSTLVGVKEELTALIGEKTKKEEEEKQAQDKLEQEKREAEDQAKREAEDQAKREEAERVAKAAKPKRVVTFGGKSFDECTPEELEEAIKNRIAISESNPGKRTKSIFEKSKPQETTETEPVTA